MRVLKILAERAAPPITTDSSLYPKPASIRNRYYYIILNKKF